MSVATPAGTAPGVAAEIAGLPFLDVKGEEFQRDPYGLLDRLRAQRWLVASPLGYTVIGHPEAREIKRDPDIVRIFDAVDAERSALRHRKALRTYPARAAPGWSSCARSSSRRCDRVRSPSTGRACRRSRMSCWTGSAIRAARTW